MDCFGCVKTIFLLLIKKIFIFRQLVKYPTHARGELLDHFWTNSKAEDLYVEQECQYYTDHDALFFYTK